MILITGAGGKTGRAVLAAVVARGYPVRALAYRREVAGALEADGAEVIVGDMRDQPLMARALQGVRAVYHICPNVHPDEIAIADTVLGAAQAVGVERFVFHSVLHPQTEKMPHHWRKLRVEEKLIESGLAYTILQPAAYMQNVLAQWETMKAQGVYRVPYAGDARLSMVDLRDVAEAAATTLTEPGHAMATYELCGPQPLTAFEVAATVGHAIERTVRVEVTPVEIWKRQARASGLDEGRVDTLARMFDFYDQYGLTGNPRVLQWLLGRPPASFADFVKRMLA